MLDTIELVRFRLQEGKTREEWLEANEAINRWTMQQPGFRFRSLSESDDGEWVDMIYWESREAAEAASKKFEAEMLEVCIPIIAPESVVISHSTAHVMQRG